ncbi:MAG: hypothetical protein KatS3mg108_0292 [Isosphaeraceae bacterium]|jgi:lysophospholipase L1-like esterase|nr:MAG: hypothetical protein KatS3mg108_0292 [Isosphaeraceae bacterium]
MISNRLPSPNTWISLGLLAIGSFPTGPTTPLLETLTDNGLNAIDLTHHETGYYQTLLNLGQRLDSLAQTRPRQHRRPFTAGPLAIPVPDLRQHALTPSLSLHTRHGTWSTSPQGLRDQVDSWTKPPGTTRLILLGDSIAAGWGVPDGRGFEPLLEAALNDSTPAPIQILNFAVPGHAPGQRWEHFLQLNGWDCQPDALLYQATPADLGWDERTLARLLPLGLAWDAPQYAPTLQRAQLQPHDASDPSTLRHRLRPLRTQLVAHVYETITAECRRRGIPTAYFLIPRVGRPSPHDAQTLLQLARNAGFDLIIDLSDAFDGLDPNTLAVAPNDYHPNATAHARLASLLHHALAHWPPIPQKDQP